MLHRVFVDTNVLYPIAVADLVLSTAEYGLFEFVYSDDSLAGSSRAQHHRDEFMPRLRELLANT